METHKEGKKPSDEIRSKTVPESVLGPDFDTRLQDNDWVQQLSEKNKVHFSEKTAKMKFYSATGGDLPLQAELLKQPTSQINDT